MPWLDGIALPFPNPDCCLIRGDHHATKFETFWSFCQRLEIVGRQEMTEDDLQCLHGEEAAGTILSQLEWKTVVVDRLLTTHEAHTQRTRNLS